MLRHNGKKLQILLMLRPLLLLLLLPKWRYRLLFWAFSVSTQAALAADEKSGGTDKEDRPMICQEERTKKRDEKSGRTDKEER